MLCEVHRHEIVVFSMPLPFSISQSVWEVWEVWDVWDAREGCVGCLEV